MKVYLIAVLLIALACGALARRGRKGKRGCSRSEGQDEFVGQHFKWTMTGLDDDDLRVTFMEGAKAPEGSTTVFKYPLDRSQKALGLKPSKIIYDFSTPEPVVVIRPGKRSRSTCIVVSSDVDTYEQLIDLLTTRNGTNGNMPEEEEAIRLYATETTNDSQFSEAVRNICSKDKCGRSIQPVYFTTSVEIEEEELDAQVAEADASPEFEPSFFLINNRLTISGLPNPRQRWGRRGQQREGRRLHRRQ